MKIKRVIILKTEVVSEVMGEYKLCDAGRVAVVPGKSLQRKSFQTITVWDADVQETHIQQEKVDGGVQETHPTGKGSMAGPGGVLLH